jgi:hypothetical protein
MRQYSEPVVLCSTSALPAHWGESVKADAKRLDPGIVGFNQFGVLRVMPGPQTVGGSGFQRRNAAPPNRNLALKGNAQAALKTFA